MTETPDTRSDWAKEFDARKARSRNYATSADRKPQRGRDTNGERRV